MTTTNESGFIPFEKNRPTAAETAPSAGRSQTGFIALMSVIIISALMLAVSLALSMSGFLARSNITDSEHKERSAALADGCVDDALIRLAASSSYAGNEVITMGDDQCTIVSVAIVGTSATIRTTATIEKAMTTIQVMATLNPLIILSWQELPE